MTILVQAVDRTMILVDNTYQVAYDVDKLVVVGKDR